MPRVLDGADLLSLSLRHNVHVSFSTGPLSLKAEGVRGSLDNLSRYIDEFKDVCGPQSSCVSVNNLF